MSLLFLVFFTERGVVNIFINKYFIDTCYVHFSLIYRVGYCFVHFFRLLRCQMLDQ